MEKAVCSPTYLEHMAYNELLCVCMAEFMERDPPPLSFLAEGVVFFRNKVSYISPCILMFSHHM